MLLDRRSFIGGALATAALAACGSDSPEASPAKTPARLGVRFPDGFRAPSHAAVGSGPQRFPFVAIAEDELPMIDAAPESIEIEITFDGALIETATVERRGTGQFTPYYPLVFTPPFAGTYVATPAFADIGTQFAVADRSQIDVFQIGEPLPPFDTPTFDKPRGVDPVCTRTEPCPFHEITLSEAITNDKPTILLIATPEFCQTDVCGPSVEFLIDAVGDRTDLNVIHAEVFADPRNPAPTGFPDLAPLLVDWKVTFEPSIYLADASGQIVDVRHFAFDSGEVEELVAAAA